MNTMSPFKQIVYENLGLHLEHLSDKELEQKYRKLIEKENSRNEKDYLFKLKNSYSGSPIWKELITEITNTETFFFRDQGLFNLLKNTIFPEKMAHSSHKTVRIWSAGCSTGEEPYSMAIIFDQILPFANDIEVLLYASDLNENAISHAQNGFYSEWSFRNMSAENRSLYFEQAEKRWKIKHHIQKKINYFLLNLHSSNYPTFVYNTDVILCRNVFIYLEEKIIKDIVAKMASVLREGGYLITGHNELQNNMLPDNLESKIYKEAVIYQKVTKTKERIPKENKTTFKYSVKPESYHKTETRKFTSTSSNIAHNRIGESYEKIPKYQVKPEKHQDFLKMAKECANQQKYDDAIAFCEQAKEKNPFDEKIYYLLAQIAEEQKEITDSIRYLQKSIYLNSSFIPAYIELGALYLRTNNANRAKKMYETSLELLKKIPNNIKIDYYENIAVQDLLGQIEKIYLQNFSKL